jgi:transposase
MPDVARLPKTEEIARCLTGTWRDEHLFNLASTLSLYDTLDRMVQWYEARIALEFESLQSPARRDQHPPAHPNRAKQRSIRARGAETARSSLWRVTGVDLTRIDGINTDAAQAILTEVGLDLSMFPSEHQFVSWVHLAPRTNISGGRPLKKKRNKIGATRVANTLRMAAASLHHSKTALGAAYRRVARHKGAGVAVFSTARKLAQLVYRMLRYGQEYVDIGEAAYESAFAAKRIASLKETARSLGFKLVEENPSVAT